MASPPPPLSQSSVPFYRDVRVLRVLVQIAFVALVLLVGWFLWNNVVRGMARIGGAFSFAFLENAASFALSETSLPYDPATDSYLYAFFIGVLNTLRVVIVGIILATLLGLVAGIARLSSNWLIAKIAQVYVEIFRNTPLLIQLFFWYFVGILKLPRVRDSIEIPGGIYLSNRGLAVPWFTPNETFTAWLVIAGAGILAAFGVYKLLGRVEKPFIYEWRGGWAFLVWLAIALAAAVALQPFTPSVPEIRGFNFGGGVTLSPEYAALLLGLVVYTGAFIAEIVRAGIQAVPRGMVEAARALGLSYIQTLRLVVIPLALRVIIPPLTNQYLNLSKNSSLAIAVGYADLFYVSNTIFNQTGQTLQVILMIMVAYLIISLIISTAMNGLNARFKLVER
ncbi:MAG: ABC transporter permease subunit [Chloroflexota bacterium]|nr:MAG: ABC transporter permease subunit [Chloroflexota bacterium]